MGEEPSDQQRGLILFTSKGLIPACFQDYLIPRPQCVRLNNYVSYIIFSEFMHSTDTFLSPIIYSVHSSLQADTGVLWLPNIICPRASQMAKTRCIKWRQRDQTGAKIANVIIDHCVVGYTYLMIMEIWTGVHMLYILRLFKKKEIF